MIKKLLGLLWIALPCDLMAEPSLSTNQAKPQTQDYNLSTFLFPINALEKEGNRVNLQLNSPKGFRLLEKEKFLKDPTSLNMLEFIPENDNENKWSEIITADLFVGKSIKASDLLSYIGKGIAQNATDSKTLEEDTTQGEFFETAILAMAYTTQGRREVVRIKAFSGPADCITIQYAVALKEGQPAEDALKKIKLWMESPENMKVFNF